MLKALERKAGAKGSDLDSFGLLLTPHPLSRPHPSHARTSELEAGPIVYEALGGDVKLKSHDYDATGAASTVKGNRTEDASSAVLCEWNKNKKIIKKSVYRHRSVSLDFSSCLANIDV